MSDDVLMRFSSNSSNQSDHSLPTKIAKLEARMVGKASSTAPSSQQSNWLPVPSAGRFGGAADDLTGPSTSSDSDDDVRLNPVQSCHLGFCFVVFILKSMKRGSGCDKKGN